MAHENRAHRRAVDREARLRRRAASLLPLALGACVTSSGSLRLEDLPAENVVRIVNPNRLAVRVHHLAEDRSWRPRAMFTIRYRDRDGQPVAVDYPVVGGWFTGGMYSETLYEIGRLPTRPVNIRAHGSLDFSRDVLLESFGQLEHRRPPAAAPCTVQLRISFLRHPHDRHFEEVLGPWTPGPCPRVTRPHS